MASRLLHGLNMKVESRSYVDAMHAILTHAGYTSASKPMLAGMTVSGFRFGVHRRLTAESVTAYNWHGEHFLAADFIGVTVSSKAGFTFSRTFPLYRKQALADIRASIDHGVGAVCWHNDQFVAVAGYEDGEESGEGKLYYLDGLSAVPLSLPYASFGVGDRENPSPYWYYQIFEGRIPMDEAAVVKESMLQAIFKWENHDGTLPETDYACGEAAYEAVISALGSGDYDRDGARATFACYAAAKRDIADYTAEVQARWEAIREAAAHYRRVAELFADIAETEIEHADELCGMFREAHREESLAIDALRRLVREAADNRFDNVGLR